MVTAPILELLAERAADSPDGMYLRFGERSITWSDLADASVRVASGLAARGVEAGDRVALMLGNSPEFLFAYYGILVAGAAAVPVNVAQRGPALGHILRDSGARLVIAEAELEQVLRAAAPDGLEIILHGDKSFDRLLEADAVAPQLPDHWE